MSEKEFTHVQVSKKTHGRLEDRKIVPRDTFDTVITTLLDLTKDD